MKRVPTDEEDLLLEEEEPNKRARAEINNINEISSTSNDESSSNQMGQESNENDENNMNEDDLLLEGNQTPTNRERRDSEDTQLLRNNTTLSVISEVPLESSTSTVTSSSTEPKEFTDVIHGTIELHPCLVDIVDTPQFQRLRGLKQLGLTCQVFPGATHSRFEHSLGVCWLGISLVKHLKSKQPDLGITDQDILCVGIAGLCHDLGHGPFSHLFDSEFITDTTWKHELGSVQMLEYLIDANEIDVKKYGLDDRDLKFINELILGRKIEGGIEARQGRDQSKRFLYDIINNEISGLDVDKLDYMLRDSFHTGIPVSIGTTIDRIIKITRVLKDSVTGELTICYPEKAVMYINGVFYSRAFLHRTVYQHKVVKACEYMVRDILRLAEPYIKIPSSIDGELYSFSDSIKDMSVYSKMRDSILDVVAMSSDPALKPAQQLLNNLYQRRIYKCCGLLNLNKLTTHGKSLDKDIVADHMVQLSKIHNEVLSKDDLIVEVMEVHYGKGEENPNDSLRFYTKGKLDLKRDRCVRISKQKFGDIFPSNMNEVYVRVFCKNDEHLEAARNAFNDYCKEKHASSPLLVSNSQLCAKSPARNQNRSFDRQPMKSSSLARAMFQNPDEDD